MAERDSHSLSTGIRPDALERILTGFFAGEVPTPMVGDAVDVTLRRALSDDDSDLVAVFGAAHEVLGTYVHTDHGEDPNARIEVLSESADDNSLLLDVAAVAGFEATLDVEAAGPDGGRSTVDGTTASDGGTPVGADGGARDRDSDPDDPWSLEPLARLIDGDGRPHGWSPPGAGDGRLAVHGEV